MTDINIKKDNTSTLEKNKKKDTSTGSAVTTKNEPLNILKSASLPEISDLYKSAENFFKNYGMYQRMTEDSQEFVKSNVELFRTIIDKMQDKSKFSSETIFPIEDIEGIYFKDGLHNNSLIYNLKNLSDLNSEKTVSYSVMTYNGSIYEQVFSADGKELLYTGTKKVYNGKNEEVNADYKVVDHKTNAYIKYTNVSDYNTLGGKLQTLESNNPATGRTENVYLDPQTGCYNSEVRESKKLLSKSSIKVLRDGSTLIAYNTNSGDTKLNVTETVNKKQRRRTYNINITDNNKTLVERKITQRPISKDNNVVETIINGVRYTTKYSPKNGDILVTRYSPKKDKTANNNTVETIKLREMLQLGLSDLQLVDKTIQEVISAPEAINNGLKILSKIVESINLLPEKYTTALNGFIQPIDKEISDALYVANMSELTHMIERESNVYKKKLKLSRLLNQINELNNSVTNQESRQKVNDLKKEALALNAEIIKHYNNISDVSAMVKKEDKIELDKMEAKRNPRREREDEEQIENNDHHLWQQYISQNNKNYFNRSTNYIHNIPIDSEYEARAASLLLEVPPDRLSVLALFDKEEDIPPIGYYISDKLPSSRVDPLNNVLVINQNMAVLLHELGHLYDLEFTDITHITERRLGLSSSQPILNVYEKELDNFRKTSTPLERNAITYFTLNSNGNEVDLHGGGIGDFLRPADVIETSVGYSETLAESHMILNALSGFEGNSLNFRSLVLMRYFPKTIAMVHEVLERNKNAPQNEQNN
ncbi:MAG: hypothetical protein LBE20_06435 [Deltaproteobacteria bacterium]|jgi:hypothetical protein|nr:hypothetical protein [Deltaproteobacteria bacterium]